jgi:hypothetical protein
MGGKRRGKAGVRQNGADTVSMPRPLLGRVQQQIAARGDYSFAGGRKPESKESLRSPHEDLRSLAHMP